MVDNLPYKWPIIHDSDVADVAESLLESALSFNHSSSSILEFESNFSEYIGAQYCLAVNSGTSALYLAFLTLNLKQGDIVLAPTYTFPSTVMPLLHLGVRVKFIDTCKGRFDMDLDSLEECVADKKVKAIVVTHMDGIPQDMEKVMKIACQYNLPVVEDCAQAFGAQIKGQSVGTFGDIAMFSLQNKKMTPGGEGGVFVTKRKDFYEKAIALSYLQKRSYDEIEDENLKCFAYTGLGHNLRIHPLAAVVANNKLKEVKKNLSNMEAVFNKLKTALEGEKLILFLDCDRVKYERSFFSIKMIFDPLDSGNSQIETFVNELNKHGVPAVLSQTKPLHLEQIFHMDVRDILPVWNSSETFAVNANDEFPNVMALQGKIIRIPAYVELNEAEVLHLVDVFTNAFKKIKGESNE